MRKRKPQVVWMPERGGYLFPTFARHTRREVVAAWTEDDMDWVWWRENDPTLRVVKVTLVPVEASRGQ